MPTIYKPPLMSLGNQFAKSSLYHLKRNRQTALLETPKTLTIEDMRESLVSEGVIFFRFFYVFHANDHLSPFCAIQKF